MSPLLNHVVTLSPSLIHVHVSSLSAAHPTPQEQPTQPENSSAASDKTPSVQQAMPTPPSPSTNERKDVSGDGGTPTVSNKDSAELVQYLQDNRRVMSQLLSLLREQKPQLNGGGRQGGEPPKVDGQPELNGGGRQGGEPPKVDGQPELNGGGRQGGEPPKVDGQPELNGGGRQGGEPPKVDGHPQTSQQWTPSHGENLHQGESPGQGWVSHSDENPFQKSGPPQDQSHSQGWITSQDQNFPRPSLNSGPSQGESPPLKSGPPRDESHSQGWITSQDQNFPRPPPNSGPSQGEIPPWNSGLSQSLRTPEDQSFPQSPQKGGPSQTQAGEPSHVQVVAPPPGDMGKPGDSSPKDNNGIATGTINAMYMYIFCTCTLPCPFNVYVLYNIACASTCMLYMYMYKQKSRAQWMPSLENWDGGLKIFYGTDSPHTSKCLSTCTCTRIQITCNKHKNGMYMYNI